VEVNLSSFVAQTLLAVPALLGVHHPGNGAALFIFALPD
jgi:hypothetical protein